MGENMLKLHLFSNDLSYSNVRKELFRTLCLFCEQICAFKQLQV